MHSTVHNFCSANFFRKSRVAMLQHAFNIFLSYKQDLIPEDNNHLIICHPALQTCPIIIIIHHWSTAFHYIFLMLASFHHGFLEMDGLDFKTTFVRIVSSAAFIHYARISGDHR